MNRSLFVFFWVATYTAFPSASMAQDEEFKNGLIGSYRAKGQQFQRIDPDVAFHWGTSSPVSQIPQSSWTVTWSGQILLRSQTPYRFYSKLNGSLTLLVNELQVLKASTSEPEWISGEQIQLSPGFQQIEIQFTPSTAGAEVKLFWSSGEFDLEPLPAHLLFYEAANNVIQQVDQGRVLFDAHHCANCHRVEKTIDQFESAPALWGVTSGTNPDWIVSKLLGKNPESTSEQMPHFGFTPEQATDIAAYLHRLEAPFDLMTSPEPKPKKGESSGRELFNSLGCLACHQVGDLGTNTPFSGGPLTHVGNKRSADWIATWLAAPDRLNPQHRMPIFKLSRSERGLLADYLATLGQDPETKFGRAERASYTESSIRGQALVKEFQCANCHKIPAIEATNQPVAVLTSAPRSPEKSCLAETPDPENQRPYFPHLDRAAVSAYLNSFSGEQPAQLSRFDQGRRVLERRQCLACHSRGATQGIKTQAMAIAKATPILEGQTQLVIPPSLNAVGDRLQDSILDEALSGKQDRIRADWLKVQMPQFQHSKAEITALKHYLIEHDRIPTAGVPSQPALNLTSNELLLTGRKLVGAGGWSCIACHQIGDYVPKNTALGTRGSDLMAIGKRLRPEFYYRWTKAPIRIIPGMEMPSFTKPVAGVLEENTELQLAAIFAAVNDPGFEAPTNPSQVEQLWQVAQGEAPRIIRDVFTVAESNGGGTVARAFAVGFANQHGMLIDLDRMAVRDWRFGDFARQRTVGKSWYWDLAGAAVLKGLDASSDLVLYDATTGLQEMVGIEPDRIAHLKDYSVRDDHVELNYDLRIRLAEKEQSFRVRERIRQSTLSEGTGWEREITPLDFPSGLKLAYRPKSQLVHFFESAIQYGTGLNIESQRVQSGNQTLITAHPEDAGKSIRIRYVSGAKSSRAALPDKPVVAAGSEIVTTWPGYVGERLSIPISIMPTAISQDDQGRLLVTSLKGDVFRIADGNGDGMEETLETIQEGLSAPFGVVADGSDVIVTHKPELLRLIDRDQNGTFESRKVVADGWGHSDNYHDWVTGPVFDQNGSLFVGTGSDYAQPNRDRALIKWRGTIIRAASDGTVEAYADELRYPIGIATDSQGRIFVSDQQGVQNTFNEINLIVQGGAYGVPGQMQGEGSPSPRPATVQIPHPWTRSVNGIFFLPENSPSPFAGHGVGCEFNSKFLIRFTTDEVDGELQGACYPLTKPTWDDEAQTFLGPISGFAAADGSIYIGSIYDSGWLGGPNVGEIVKLKAQGEYGNGIREIRAVPEGFQIEFISPVDAGKAIDTANYSISGYTRIWQGSYATEDSGRYSPEILAATLAADQRTVTLKIQNLKPKFVYEFNIGEIGKGEEVLFPAFAVYTLNRLPK